jgi:hypothetical protein
MGAVIQLFKREAPVMTADESEFWAWGQENADDWVNNADGILEDIKTADTEAALMAALRELKDEVAKIPGLD